MVDFKTENGISNCRRTGAVGQQALLPVFACVPRAKRRTALLVSLFVALMISATTHVERAWAGAISVVSVPDFDDGSGGGVNGADEIAVLGVNSTDKIRVAITDASSGNLIKDVLFGPTSTYTPLAMAVVPDFATSSTNITLNGAPEIAVMRVWTSNGKVEVAIKDASSGNLVSPISGIYFGLSTDFEPIAMAVIPDIDGNGYPEVAVLGEIMTGPNTGLFSIKVNDSSTGNWIKNLFFNAGYPAVAMAVVPDVDGNGADELAVLGVGDDALGGVLDEVTVVIKDTLTGNNIGSTIYFGTDFPVSVAMEVVPDFNNNGKPEIAVLGVRASDGKVKVAVRDALSGSLIKNLFFSAGYPPVAMAVVSDFDDGSGGGANGVPEIAVLGVRASDGKGMVTIKDASTNDGIKTIYFTKNYPSVGMAVLNNFAETSPDYTTADEIAVLGVRASDSRIKVSIKDAFSATLIRSIMRPTDACEETNPLLDDNATTYVPTATPSGKLNIVLIYTDDQRWDDLWADAMPTVKNELIDKGAVFRNAFVTNPWCCPSRASLFSGGFYSHNTGVLSVYPPNGNAQKFVDNNDLATIATLLQSKGYKTAITGKYMNGYEDIVDPDGDGFYYIPPGWDWFRSYDLAKGWFGFNAYLGNSTSIAHGHGSSNTEAYLLYYERNKALDFLNNIVGFNSSTPFFLMLSTHAPHEPATPPYPPTGTDCSPVANNENQYYYDCPNGLEYPPFIDSFLYRDRSYDEGDNSDKPWYVQYENEQLYYLGKDGTYKNMLKSLWQVDNVVKDIMDKVAGISSTYDTVYIFTSDNGLLWGDHGLIGKRKPYEESIRIPLIIKMPYSGTAPTPGRIDELVAMDLDLAPTILELAGVTNTLGGDGKSLLPLLDSNSSGTWTSRSEMFFESFESGRKQEKFPPTWTAIRTDFGGDTWKYVEYVTGEKELYDLTSDPCELESKHLDPDQNSADAMADLKGKLDPLKGLAIRTDNLPEPGKNQSLPDGTIGDTYSGFQFFAWGGTGTYTWSADTTSTGCTAEYLALYYNDITNGLPTGMSLSTSGLLSDTPTTAGTYSICIKVVDQSTIQPGGTLQYDGPQSYIKRFRIKINSQ